MIGRLFQEVYFRMLNFFKTRSVAILSGRENVEKKENQCKNLQNLNQCD